MKTSVKVLYWLPRIICILAILFVSMFALDAFEPGLTLMVQLQHFFIHLIPSFILLLFLVIAWKWELIGGILFVIIGLGFSVPIFQLNHYRNHFTIWQSLVVILMINLPFIIVGMLFIVSHSVKRRNRMNV